MNEGIDDKSKNKRRIKKEDRNRKERRDKRKVNNEIKIMKIDKNIIMIEIEREKKKDKRNKEKRNIEDRIEEECEENLRMGNDNEVMIYIVFRKNRKEKIKVRIK